MRRRLFRCGLAASMDHTLRLAFSAHAGDHQDVASHLDLCIMWLWPALNLRAVPMLPPTGTRGSAGEVPSSSSGSGGGVGASVCGEQHQEQLGLLHTLAKQAAVVSRAFDAAPWPADITDAAAEAERRKKALYSALSVLMALVGAMAGLHEQLEQGTWLGRGPEASGVGQGGPGRVVEHACDTVAFAARAACSLAAVLSWELSYHLAAMAAAEVAEGGEQGGLCLTLSHETMEQQYCMVKGVVDVLMRVMLLLRDPRLLSAAQVLASQPHRLLAAACALATALPMAMRGALVGCVGALVIMLASHEALCAQVRNWLVPPPDASYGSDNGGGGDEGQGGGADGGGDGADGCEDAETSQGCLWAPVWMLARDGFLMLPLITVRVPILLRAATGEVRIDADPPSPAGGCGDGGVLAEEDWDFRECALEIVGCAYQLVDAIASGTLEGLETGVPTDPETVDLVHWVVDVEYDGQLPTFPPPPSAPSGTLPPPLALPPSRAGAFPRLRVCGNPRCANFACEREGFMQLKQCGRCRAVRYCGADCQRAHWREGHRAECQALAAAAEEEDR